MPIPARAGRSRSRARRGPGRDDAEVPTPFESLRVMATQAVRTGEGVHHVEQFSADGLLSTLWHGGLWDAEPGRGPEAVVVCASGAMGGLLGPARGVYHRLGEALAATGIATVRIGWRAPNDLARCVVDAVAVLELALRRGARRAVVVGHSFGGAVAVQAGAATAPFTVGVVTLATQSAGCEGAGALAGTPLLCVHGDADELLPVSCSTTVAGLAGGKVAVIAGAGHLLDTADDALFTLLEGWITDVLSPRTPAGSADLGET